MYDVDRLLRLHNGKISVIGLFAQEYQPDDPSGRYELIKTGYDDNSQAGPVELSSISNLADDAADLFSTRLREGKSCLSSCAAGLNRSGLVSALTIMKAAGLDPAAAIDTVRKNRDAQQGMSALSNPRFVETIHKMGPTAGSKSTWTTWRR
jgi:hypothetical protein